MTPTETDVAHRQAFEAFVLERAESWHRQHLGRLYAHWEEINKKFFNGELVVPYVLLAEPASPTTYGVTRSISSFGGRCEIRLRPSLLKGTHPHMKAGTQDPEGLFRFVADALLHETIHQWQQEILHEVEDAFHGHGPIFSEQCNLIGAQLGLGRVRSSKRRGPDKDLPSCAQWPSNVRPADYYLGAWVPPSRDAEVVNLADTAASQMLQLADTLGKLGLGWQDRPEQEVGMLEDAQAQLAEAFEDIGLWVTNFFHCEICDEDDDCHAALVPEGAQP